MPGVIKMNISGLNYAHINRNLSSLNANQVNIAPKPIVQKSSSLNSPMVSRIFNVKPGCGSCGK